MNLFFQSDTHGFAAFALFAVNQLHSYGLEPIRITPVTRVMSATRPNPRRSNRAYRDAGVSGYKSHNCIWL